MQQTNALYGANPTRAQHHQSTGHNSTTEQREHITNNVFDLMMSNIHQQQQQSLTHHQQTSSSLFDSAYGGEQTSGDETMAPVASSHTTTNVNNPSRHHHQQKQNQMSSSNNKHNNNTQDISLYSPSSSTSLLYHIYDQINLPNEQHQQTPMSSNYQSRAHNKHLHHHNQQQHQISAGSILNPTNLFNQQTNNLLANNGNNNNPKVTTIQQHELYGSSMPISSDVTVHHTQQQQPPNYAFQTNNNHMYSSDFQQRNMHHLATTARQHHRPLSSSSISNHHHQFAEQFGYGRTNPMSYRATLGKSQSSNLASVLHHHHTAAPSSSPPPLPPLIMGGGPLIADSMGYDLTSNSTMKTNKHPYSSTTSASSPVSQFSQNKHNSNGLGAIHLSTLSANHLNNSSCHSSNNKWKRAQKRARNLVLEHSMLFKCAFLLILIAFCLMSAIKLVQQQQQATASNFQQRPPAFASNINPLLYPPPIKLFEQNGFSSAGQAANSPTITSSSAAATTTNQLSSGLAAGELAPSIEADSQDLLKSKLLIGEFVVQNQNYSQSPAHRALLAENLVKLMDQVFLSTDVRRVYSRMEVTNIRPNRQLGGIVVNCNIVLSDSIASAAQFIGFALYESLVKSNEKLANHASFVIDKNSIRFNTVPDKDLRSGSIPPGLLGPETQRELGQLPVTPSSGAFPSPDQPAMGEQNGQQQDGQRQTSNGQSDSPVVWSAWSQWSSCVDKNGLCDPQTLHSRLRKCLAQRTGEKVEAMECRQRFNMQDQELEVSDCAQHCAQAAAGQQQSTGPSSADSNLMSDAPQGPPTAPSVMLAGQSMESQQQPVASFLLPAPLSNSNINKPSQESSPNAVAKQNNRQSGSTPDQVLGIQAEQQQAGQSSSTTERMIVAQTSSMASSNLAGVVEPSSSMPPQVILEKQQQQQMSCSNCTLDEICLLLVQQKVPFCAKIKDRLDESGCGGWCKPASGQLCQPVGLGSNAFKCVHDSECLPDEWRCHDSACIPLAKRCDGHFNCYDNSDERDCLVSV